MAMHLSRIAFIPLRSATVRTLVSDVVMPKTKFLPTTSNIFSLSRQLVVRNYSSDTIHPTVALENANIPLKKKVIHKKHVLEDVSHKEGHYVTLAYATAVSYDLKSLKEALVQQKLYEPGKLKTQNIGGDVVVANQAYSAGSEPREIIFFREGAVVFWNYTELEARDVLDFVRPYEIESYPRDVIAKEREVMTYVYQNNAKKCHLQESCFVMAPDRDNSLERFTFSHAMVQSARLGAWEARFGTLAASVREHSAAMEREGAAYVDKKKVVRKLGELFSLRHRLNVDSDILDTPDFYWEAEELERLYTNTLAYFTISKRTRILNERLSRCANLLQLLSSWAADRHHVRLEWMVIVLFFTVVCFEMLHMCDRYIPRTVALQFPNMKH